MNHYYVGKTDGSITKKVFDTYEDAVTEIQKILETDPEGVEAGEYYIDGPETRFSDLEVGQRFKFQFEANGEWEYVKRSSRLFSEVSRPAHHRDQSDVLWDISIMDNDSKVVIVEK